MTDKRILAASAAVALTLGLGAGIAAAQSDPTPPSRPADVGTMHDGDMDTLHAQMPEQMRAQCDTTHAQSGGMTDRTTMNDMSGDMMGGSMGAGSMGGDMMGGDMMGGSMGGSMGGQN
jgi:hypothetical protein